MIGSAIHSLTHWLIQLPTKAEEKILMERALELEANRVQKVQQCWQLDQSEACV